MKDQPQGFESGVAGAAPQRWFGKGAPDAARAPWATAPVGSEYFQKPNTRQCKKLRKVAVNNRADDWAAGVHVINVRITRAMMTDGGGTSGTFDLTEQIPIGAYVVRAALLDVVGFTGNTSAVINIGDGSDVDRYNTGNPSVFTTAAAIDVGVPSGAGVHTAAVTPRVTITGNSDFTAISAGELTLRLWILM